MPPPFPVLLTSYDPAWPKMAAEYMADLQVLGSTLVTVHHIGSTSVPGLAAKPIIDLMPSGLDVDPSTSLRALAKQSIALATGTKDGLLRFARNDAEESKPTPLGIMPVITNLDALDRKRSLIQIGLAKIRSIDDPAWENAGKDGGRRCAFPPYAEPGCWCAGGPELQSFFACFCSQKEVLSYFCNSRLRVPARGAGM